MKVTQKLHLIGNWMLTPVATLSLTMVLAVILCAGLISLIVFFIAIAMLVISQLVNFVRAFYDTTPDRGKLNRHLAMTCVAIAFPFLMILNMRAIDYAATYMTVRVMEPYFLRNAETSSVRHSVPGSRFKYFRLGFGQMAANKRWLVYDESGQVQLDYQKRNAEWWTVSKEFEEGEGCATNGRRLFSHFYVQYYGC